MHERDRRDHLTREELERQPGQELRSATATRPRLTRMEVGGQAAVVKDYRPCGWVMRTLAGPWLIGREARVYRALAGCPGVPRLIGRVDRQALAVEYIKGRNARQYADGTLPREFFDRLQQVVDAMHARGVVHCDLKNRQNIVVAEGYQPYLVDFTTAFGRGRKWQLLRRYAYKRFRMDDRRAVVKARLQVGRIGTEEDARFAFYRSPAERILRGLRNGLRWVFKALSRIGPWNAGSAV